MPSFVPYADLKVNSNWFKLTNPKKKLMDAEFAMRLSHSVKTIETCAPRVYDAECYRDGDLDNLMSKAKQLSNRLPYQATKVQIPYENTLGGFAMFNTGVTDLAPELIGFYGAPSINPCQATTLFLVGNHFSVHQTRVIAGGVDVSNGLSTSALLTTSSEMLSRQVLKVVIQPNPLLVGNNGQRFVDVHLATPYGLSQHLLIPVCNSGSQVSCPPQSGAAPPPSANSTQPPTVAPTPTAPGGAPGSIIIPPAPSAPPAPGAAQAPGVGGAHAPAGASPPSSGTKGTTQDPIPKSQ
jgi:hypothetical protein